MNFDCLISDLRLQDIFGTDTQGCVLQVWLLEFKSGEKTLVKWLYGRAIPADFTNNQWSGNLKTKMTTLPDQDSARVLPFTAYISAGSLKHLAENLIKGFTLYDASIAAKIIIDDKVAKIFKFVTFESDICVRPIMHLPTRDYFKSVIKRLSPSSFASYDSGAISLINKATMFESFGNNNATNVARIACDSIDADTGMRFSEYDAWRFGDFEFLCAPALSRKETSRLLFKAKGEFASLTLFESLTHYPARLLVIIKSFSGDCLQSTHVTTIGKNETYPITKRFDVDSFKKQAATACTLEILAQQDDTDEAFMCVFNGYTFIRNMNMNLNVHQSIRTGGKTDWLAKQVPKGELHRLEGAWKVSRSTTRSQQIYGDYNNDQWVDLNYSIESSLSRLLPKKSKSRFFPKLSDSRGMSRLELVAWLRKTFDAHPCTQIAWFDPYMEDVGIDLLHIMGTETGDYLVFTSEKSQGSTNLQKTDTSATIRVEVSKEINESSQQITDSQAAPCRIQNLIQKCQEWGNSSFGNVHLRVVALPANKIHDRMILVRSPEGLPVAGYHVSNSIQLANENNPLLVTSIPEDVLPDIFNYMDDLIESSLYTTEESKTAKVIFDSQDHDTNPGTTDFKYFTPFDFKRSGDVFAWWLNHPEMNGLYGEKLRETAEKLDLYKNDSLNEQKFGDIPSHFWEKGFDLEPFNCTWDAFGKILANLPAGELYRMGNRPLLSSLEDKLIQYLGANRQIHLDHRKHSRALIDYDRYLDKDLHFWLKDGGSPERIFSYSPGSYLYGDYYAIALMWMKSPIRFIRWLSEQINSWSHGNVKWAKSQVRLYDLITTALRHICVDPYHGNRQESVNALISSGTPILQWIGLHFLSDQIKNNDDAIQHFDKLDCFSTKEKLYILCWLINEANYFQSDSREALVKHLRTLIQQPLADQEFQELLEPVRGHSGRLHHMTAWILEALLVPMLEQGVVNPRQIASQWLEDLIVQWRPEQHIFFDMKREGAFTDELAIIFSCLNEIDQLRIINNIEKVADKMARNIRKPISAQVDWRIYSYSHFVNLWIFALSSRLQLFTKAPKVENAIISIQDECNSLIDRLSQNYRDVLSNDELIKYSMGDPEQLRSHLLLGVVSNIANKGQE
ncbi:VPA1262 family protein [Pectobacterium carotovorum]|uniref:VPA1262 family protein n=1 Tax=Pectobacterium carotovorum TaxID=554 RepID=UPI00380725B6